jgi:hypothetical protein
LPATPLYADLPARLAALDAQEGSAYLRHARGYAGADTAFLKLFTLRYELRAALAEQNPAFAATLLPVSGASAPAGVGLPLLPAGILLRVDAERAGYVTITLDVAGPAALIVTPPVGPAFAVALAAAPTRQTAAFKAPLDGVYALHLAAQGASLGTVYVVVSRREYALFRELSRALAFGFRPSPPRPSDDYLEMLACLVFAEASAQVGNPTRATQMLAAARAVTQAETPVGIYPYPNE